jgi:hypothetical protein
MPNNPISHRVNLLPQAEQPENLYKRSLTQARLPEKPSQSEAPILNRSTESPPQPLRPESSRPRQSLASRQQAVEARVIAQRVQDTSGSSRLEFLLRRQQGKRYEHWQKCQPLMALEHLAIARRSNQGYQIVIQGRKMPFSRHIFQTVQYCADAAAELEQKFALGGMLEFLNAEGQEAVETIIWAFVVRERVAMALAA